MIGGSYLFDVSRRGERRAMMAWVMGRRQLLADVLVSLLALPERTATSERRVPRRRPRSCHHAYRCDWTLSNRRNQELKAPRSTSSFEMCRACVEVARCPRRAFPLPPAIRGCPSTVSSAASSFPSTPPILHQRQLLPPGSCARTHTAVRGNFWVFRAPRTRNSSAARGGVGWWSRQRRRWAKCCNPGTKYAYRWRHDRWRKPAQSTMTCPEVDAWRSEPSTGEPRLFRKIWRV